MVLLHGDGDLTKTTQLLCSLDQAYGLDPEQDKEMDSQFHSIPHNVIEQLYM